MLTFFIFSSLLIAIFLIVFILLHKNTNNKRYNRNIKSSPKQNIPCILCGHTLLRGERLKSEEYKSKNDSLVYLYGCPYCYGQNAVNIRKCPVCGHILKDEEILFGRMFERKENKKKHLHINGCNYCRNK